jgi:hypothetical protein
MFGIASPKKGHMGQPVEAAFEASITIQKPFLVEERAEDQAPWIKRSKKALTS